MIRPGLFLRLIHINLVLIRHGLDEVVLATHLFRPLRFIYYLSPWNWLRRERAPRAVRIRRTLEDLGPIFVKFGQILSTRRDLLPDDIAIELNRLQDRVPPFPGREARAIVERAYGRSLAEVFDHFDEQPLASASVAQVHAVRLKDGREAVLKVVRPGIQRTIRRDVDLLYTVAELAERYWPDGRRLRPLEVVAEFEKTIFDELDLQREAANASLLRRNFINSGMVYIPEVYWPYVHANVMVMERISGVPVNDIETLKRHGTNMKRLGELGVEIFFTQVFRDSFFHADMHPGNIFVDISDPENPHYISVDFGIMGSLSAEDQRYLALNLLAFFNRDYRRVAELHVESGWVPYGTRVEEFEAAIRTVCEPIFERPLKDISFGHFLLRLFQTARRFNMEVQPQLVLLQKTLLNIEGLGRMLYPELDLWTTAKPYMERWLSEQVGPRALVKNLRASLPLLAERLPEMPAMIYDIARSVRERERQGGSDQQWRLLRREIRRANRRSFLALTGAALVVSAAVLLGLDGYGQMMFGRAPVTTWILAALGGAMLMAAWPRDTDGD